MGICLGKPNKEECSCRESTNPSTYTATRVLKTEETTENRERKRQRPEVFLYEGVRQNPGNYSIVAIEIKPGDIQYAEMVQSPSAGLKKGRDNVKCPLDEDLAFNIDPNSSYVRLKWLKEVQQEVGENESEEPINKRYNICEVAGSQIQQRENEIFPTALIKVPRNFASMAATVGESSSHDRLNFLVFSKQ
jgi:hypothetical protein